jgi:hypothetical protein
MGLGPDQPYRLHEGLADSWQDWRGPQGRITLDPQRLPAAIFSLHR